MKQKKNNFRGKDGGFYYWPDLWYYSKWVKKSMAAVAISEKEETTE